MSAIFPAVPDKELFDEFHSAMIHEPINREVGFCPIKSDVHAISSSPDCGAVLYPIVSSILLRTHDIGALMRENLFD